MTQTLQQHRKKASDLSLGASHEGIYQKALELIREFKLHGQHLDFGSGRGAFLEKICKEIPELSPHGVDLMSAPESLVTLVQWTQADLNEDLPFNESSFDSISALEIIEHLENPRHLFRELYRILKSGGLLIMSTPNNESWRALLSYWRRGHFVAFTDRDYPAHITALNRKDLMRSAREAGFEFLKFDFSPLGSVPGYTRLSWQQISMGWLQGLRFSDNIFIVLRKN
jgi:2-polyprenyl-3-methyl-5-hydroxy-6-metoxy-1,4-benzoquinol methylase